MKIVKLSCVAFAMGAALSSFAAPRTGPWTKEQAWEWYNAQPWIRGCNYMPASAANRYDMWQVWDCERRFEEMERELALAESIGFNAVRIIIAEDNGFAVWCEDHDGYMRNLERFLALCGKHKIRAIMCLGNDCSRPKPLWSVPKPGPQPVRSRTTSATTADANAASTAVSPARSASSARTSRSCGRSSSRCAAR